MRQLLSENKVYDKKRKIRSLIVTPTRELAKNNMAQAESQVVQSKYEYIFRVKILELLK